MLSRAFTLWLLAVLAATTHTSTAVNLMASPLAASAVAAGGVLDARDVSLRVSSDALNSAGKVYEAAGVLHVTDLIPGNVTTDALAKVLPKAHDLCPGCPLSLTLSATQAPAVSITEKLGAQLAVVGARVNLTAAPAAGGQAQSLVLLGFNGTCGLNFTHTPRSAGEFLTADISILEIHLVVESSNVGILPQAAIAIIDPLVDAFLKHVAIPAFNREFPGFPLPTVKGFPISNVLITTNAGYLGVGLDITPQQQQKKQQQQQQQQQRQQRHSVARKLIVGRRLANPPGFSGPGVVATVGGAGLTKVLQGLLPQVVQKVNGITIPAMSGKASGISYSVDAIKISGFAIGASKIEFVEGKGSAVTLGGLSLQLPSTGFKIKKKVLFAKISCSGHFSGSLGNTQVVETVNVTAVEPAGTPKLAPSSSWNWAGLGVSVKMDHTICKIIKNIASWFIGNINHKIEDVIKSQVPSVVDGLIQSQGNEILQNLMLEKKIDSHAEVNFYLTENPFSADDALSVPLSGEFVPAPAA